MLLSGPRFSLTANSLTVSGGDASQLWPAMDDIEHMLAMGAEVAELTATPKPTPLPPPRTPCERVDRIVRRTRTRAHIDQPRGTILDRGLWLHDGLRIDVTDCAPERFMKQSMEWLKATHCEQDDTDVYAHQLPTWRAGPWGDFVRRGDRVVFATDPSSERWLPEHVPEAGRVEWERSALSVPAGTFRSYGGTADFDDDGWINISIPLK